jgi:hypothetical protein
MYLADLNDASYRYTTIPSFASARRLSSRLDYLMLPLVLIGLPLGVAAVLSLGVPI